MATPPAPEHHLWLPDTNANLPTYTRPLVGSELFTYKFSKLAAGGYDVSMGVKFHSTLAKSDLQTRTRGAFERLRFHCPLIAASIDDKAAWVYTPVQDDSDREAWLQGAFVFEDRGPDLDFEDFISSLTQLRLPYEVDGRSLFFRCYLVAGSEPNYALVFHGSHAIMDAWPTLNRSLFWGTEWNNLPPDPVTATGGPCATWDTDGAKLYEAIAANRSRQAPPGKPIRIIHRFTESESQAIVAVTKANECTVSHLLEAAHCLALAACNPPDPAGEADFGAEMTIASPEQNALCIGFRPSAVRIGMTDILKNNSKVQQMQLTMQALKEQYKQYLDNPCIYHLLVAQKPFTTPYTRPQFRSMLTNIGVTEKRLRTTWKGQGGEPIFEIDELLLGNRMTTAMTSSTPGRSKMLSISNFRYTSDMWNDAEGNDAIMQKFVAEIVRHVRLLLPDVLQMIDS
ncbi:hypothetical protein BU15DRAFT_65596 [Melanogaster broomeanus]|nr:hypothetical protein BU15DRAFT_65596 [Melanogaster broomeanus]